MDYELGVASFKLFSLKTLKYLLISYFPFILFPGVTFLLQPSYCLEYTQTMSKVYSAFDLIWFLAFNIGSNILAPLIMLVVAEAFGHLSEISLSRNIPMLDRSALLHTAVTTVFVISGYCLMNLGHYLSVEPHLDHFLPHQNYLLVAGYIGISLYSCGFCYSVPLVLALTWVSHIKTKIDGKHQAGQSHYVTQWSLAKENTLPWVRSCIDLYHRVQTHLGFFFFGLFSQLQLMWIEALFLALSLPINRKTDFLPMIIQCIGGKKAHYRIELIYFIYFRIFVHFNWISHLLQDVDFRH